MTMLFLLKYWKFGVLGILVLAGIWFHRNAVARAYEQGATEKQVQMLKDEADRIEAATAASRAQMALQQAELDGRANTLNVRETALNSQQRALATQLQRGLGEIQARLTDETKGVVSAPAGQLPDVIRGLNLRYGNQ